MINVNEQYVKNRIVGRKTQERKRKGQIKKTKDIKENDKSLILIITLFKEVVSVISLKI